MLNIFENMSKVIKETESIKYVSDGKIPEWVALRLIELSEKAYSGKKQVNRISTTEFSKSDKQILLAQQRILKPYQIEVDVSTLQNSVNGSIIHEAYLGEEPKRIEKKIGKWVISGQADRIKNNILNDLKNVSVYAGKDLFRELELYPEYYDIPLEDLEVKCPSIFKYLSQLSIYNWLYDLPSENVGIITFIFNNWSYRDEKTISSRNLEVEFKLANHTKIVDYLTKRLERLSTYQESGYLPDCSSNALGTKSTSTYKVVKYGGTRAVSGSGGSFNSLNEASLARANFPNTEIREFKSNSDPTLCLKWCQFNIKGICDQGQEIKENYKRN